MDRPAASLQQRISRLRTEHDRLISTHKALMEIFKKTRAVEIKDLAVAALEEAKKCNQEIVKLETELYGRE